MQADASRYVTGALLGLAAVTIWASWSAVTRFAVTTSLDAWDIAALRFGVPGLVLLPVVIRRGFALDRLGWRGLAAMIIGGGVPYALIAAHGLRFAPAHDQAALNPGFMPLFVALLAAWFLDERLAGYRKVGLGLIVAGAIVIVGWSAAPWLNGWSEGFLVSRSFGHALFLLAALLWAVFTIVLRSSGIDPLHAVALISTGSLALYLPFYIPMNGARLIDVPIGELGVQAVFQGLMVTIVSLLLYGRAVAILGASGGAAFGALVPALSALFAIPLLGEWPSGTDWIGIILVSAGVYLASGGPPPRSLR